MPETPRSGVTAHEAWHQSSESRAVISAETFQGGNKHLPRRRADITVTDCLTDPEGEDNPVFSVIKLANS